MRTKYSIKNSVTAIILYIINVLLGFISQVFFIKILNIEYLGLSNVCINILSIIQIIELGMGNLIIYYLYDPVFKNNHSKIRRLLSFYKKWCLKLSLVFFVISILIIPFLKNIIGNITINVNVYIVYLLFIISNIIHIFYNYNISLVYADQKNYYTNIVHLFYLIILNIIQLIVLYQTKNFYLYLIIKIVFQIIENIIIVYLKRKMYPYLKNNKYVNDKRIIKFIIKDIKPLIVHKVKEAIIYNIDNLVLSIFLGISIVGLYSNYFLLVNYLNTLFAQIIIAVGASVGNLLVLKNYSKNFDVYKKLKFLNFWLATFSGIILINVVEPFIEIWLGKEYLLEVAFLIAMVFCHFMRTMGCTYQLFYSNSGIYRKDILGPLLEVSFHVVFSIIFVKIFGVIGIIIAGIISNSVLWFYVYPKYIYKDILKGNMKDYIKENIGYILLFVLLIIINYIISLLINVSNIYINFLIKVIISVIVPNLILILIFRKTSNFKYFYNLTKKVFRKYSKN